MHGNAAWDAIHSVLSDKHQEEPLTQARMAHAVEQAIRGFVEIESTFLRMYYIANKAPGQRPITGNFTVMRVGYKGSISSLVALLPLYLTVAFTLVYVSLGIRTDQKHVSNFNPTRSTSLILAAAAGGIGKVLLGKGDTDPDDKVVQEMKVRFEGVRGFRIMEDPVSTDDVERALLEKP
ncbi:hypothetical protein FGG08_000381 [Glutinoglossum americanum]|uniref:Uncharacterized protein n=1 Tax=Glutinoglossum americanum TaxID=1670608 RepID=A0A9P8L619_9PEZI|nr:hypothetical protein FGG08_000381 [Glutinoglossum americanum]